MLITSFIYKLYFLGNKIIWFVQVVLSAGTINSAQILMLSGVGPRAHLQQVGIPVIHDLKVGNNLQDHAGFAGLTFIVDKPVAIVQNRLQVRPIKAWLSLMVFTVFWLNLYKPIQTWLSLLVVTAYWLNLYTYQLERPEVFHINTS